MNKALIIIPYFGKLPIWFQTFLDSCQSKLLDFLLITDDASQYDYAGNFTVLYQSFDDFKHFFKESLGEEVYLEHPYKLCDYRPAYGKVFHSRLTDYKYWGHCDIDLVFGDIDHFIESFFKEGFDKFSRFGHFSLYRNTVENNSLYKKKTVVRNFDFIKQTSIPCLFDEIAINKIFTKNNKKLIQSQLFHNVNINYKNFAVGDGLPTIPTLIVKRGIKLYLIESRDGKLVENEFFYVHMQRRPNIPKANASVNYVITVDGFLPFHDEENLLDMTRKYGLPVSAEEELVFRNLCKKMEFKTMSTKLKRELYFFKLKGLYNIFYHYFLIKRKII